jgi:hypothetical protein
MRKKMLVHVVPVDYFPVDKALLDNDSPCHCVCSPVTSIAKPKSANSRRTKESKYHCICGCDQIENDLKKQNNDGTKQIISVWMFYLLTAAPLDLLASSRFSG